MDKTTVVREGYIKRNCIFKEKNLRRETSDGFVRVGRLPIDTNGEVTMDLRDPSITGAQTAGMA